MAERYLGIDLGTSAVRCVCLESDGKHVSIVRTQEEPVLRNENGSDYSVALSRIFGRVWEKGAVVAVNLPSSLALTAHKVLPFNDPNMLEPILSPALSNEWQITDNDQLAFEVGPKVDAAEEGAAGGYDILALLYPKDVIRQRIELLQGGGCDPHILLPTQNALGYGLKGLKGTPMTEGVYGILDMGASETVLHILDGETVILTRSIRVGGQKVTETIAEQMEVSLEDAEELKCRCGFVADDENAIAVCTQMMSERMIPEMTVGYEEVVGACMDGIQVLFSTIRQSLASLFYSKNIAPTRIYVTGGAAKLYGLLPMLSEECEVPFVQMDMPVQLPDSEALSSFPWAAFCMAYAALDGADGKCMLNLRKGEFSHKGSFEYIKDKAWLIGAVAIILLVSIIFMAVTSGSAVRLERDRLKAALEEATEEILGEKVTNEGRIVSLVSQANGYNYIPTRTAFSHFNWISSTFHTKLSDVAFDLNYIEINNLQKTVTLKGEVEGDDGLSRILEVLESYECFPDEIAEPKTSKSRDKTTFTLKIEANHCKMGGASE